MSSTRSRQASLAVKALDILGDSRRKAAHAQRLAGVEPSALGVERLDLIAPRSQRHDVQAIGGQRTPPITAMCSAFEGAARMTGAGALTLGA